MIATYQDAVQHILDYLGSDPSDAALRDAKKSVQEAYRDFANTHNWSYLYTSARIVTEQPYSTGTVTYLYSTGTYPRQLTLTGGVWPAWAGDGLLLIGDSNYRTEYIQSSTVLTLDEMASPIDDITINTPFSVYKDSYYLPCDFISQDTTFIPGNFGGLEYVHPREWLIQNEGLMQEGRPRHYTVTGSHRYSGTMVSRISPLPDDRYAIHYGYKRRPRALTTYCEATGFMSVLSGTTPTGNTLVASAGASFSAQDKGSIIRMDSAHNEPTDESGDNPAFFEATISNVISPTQANIDPVCPVALSGVAYTLSDPLDIEPGAMMSAFTRLCEQKLSVIRIMKDRSFPISEYQAALERAKAADSRSFMRRVDRGSGFRGVGCQRVAVIPMYS